MALANATFLQNHWLMQVGAAVQSVFILFLIWVSVFKPWKKKAEA